MIIKSTKHTIKAANCRKQINYTEFLTESSRVALHAVDSIWCFYVDAGNLSIPKLLNYKLFIPIDSLLSARAAQCAVNTAGGIVRAVIEKQRRVEWVNSNKGTTLKDKKFKKPTPNFIASQLNANCAVFKPTSGKFQGFLILSNLGKTFGKIILPVVRNPRVGGTLKKSFLLNKRNIQLVWELEDVANNGKATVALDQGFKTVATLSDGQTSPETDKHGYSFELIADKLARKKKGSRAFRKAQAHRKNFVNWSINQLNFTGVKELRLEKVVNIRFRRNTSRKLSHWSNPEIRDKIISRCAELNVSVVEQPCSYRSQRCSSCGNVRKANRKAKHYDCKNCGFSCDADLNAALNHLGDLPSVPSTFLGKRLNLGLGFFWKESGFFAFTGEELVSPSLQQLPYSSQK